MSLHLESIFPSNPKTERGKFIVLGSNAKHTHYLYVNGNNVIIRNINDDADNDIYSQHSSNTTVAKYSPSGFYIASADSHGKIRIWDTTQKEHILKNEFQPFVGAVKDLVWSSDNQRICAVGEGREKFGVVFNAETGTTTGEVMGMSRAGNCVDFRPERPFRIAIGSEDNSTCFFEGPPFKFKSVYYKHSSFVNTLRYSPTGAVFVTGGADGLLVVHDGKSGEPLGTLGEHKGGVYSVSFKSDGQLMVSVSGDKTMKVWQVLAVDSTEEQPKLGHLVQEYCFENHLDNFLVGCVWMGTQIVVVNLKSHILIFDENDVQAGPKRVLAGHNKPITGLLFAEDTDCVNGDQSGSGGFLLSSSMDSDVALWNVGSGRAGLLQRSESAAGHKNQIDAMTFCEPTCRVLATVGVDDCLVLSRLESDKSTGLPTGRTFWQTKLPSQPKAVDGANWKVGVVCVKNLAVFQLSDGNQANQLAALEVNDFEPSAVAFTLDGGVLFVGAKHDGLLRAFRVGQSEGLTRVTGAAPLQLRGQGCVQARRSPDGRWLAVCDVDRYTQLFQIDEAVPGLLQPHQVVNAQNWRTHVARIQCLAWTADSRLLATGGVDGTLCVWDRDQADKRTHTANAHASSPLTGLAWRKSGTLFSASQDANIRQWRFN